MFAQAVDAALDAQDFRGGGEVKVIDHEQMHKKLTRYFPKKVIVGPTGQGGGNAMNAGAKPHPTSRRGSAKASSPPGHGVGSKGSPRKVVVEFNGLLQYKRQLVIQS